MSSVFVVMPSGQPCPPFFGSALEALTEAQATGGDAYWRLHVNGREAVRITLAAADAALQTVVVAALPSVQPESPEESDASSASVLDDDECSYCGEIDCDRVCGRVAKRLCTEWAQLDFWPPTRPASSLSDAAEGLRDD